MLRTLWILPLLMFDPPPTVIVTPGAGPTPFEASLPADLSYSAHRDLSRRANTTFGFVPLARTALATLGLSGWRPNSEALVSDTPTLTEQPSGAVSVRDYGALGDGVSDDTAAIQAAIDAISSGTVIFPQIRSCYSSGNLLVSNKTDFVLDGNNQSICWRGTAPPGMRIGIQYSGTLTNVIIQNFLLNGDGVPADGHAGVYGLSGARLKNFKILSNHVYNVTLGISVNANLGGSIDGFEVDHNYIYKVLGTDPGQGYGIHHANGSGQSSEGRITNNTVVLAERHSIYQAKGSGVVIANNTILSHRNAVPGVPGSPTPAIMIARSSDIIADSNTVISAKDGSLGIFPDIEYPCSDVSVTNTVIADPVGPFQPVTIGSSDPAGEGVCTDIEFSGNSISYSVGRTNPTVEIYSGKGIFLSDNSFTAASGVGMVAAIAVRGLEETAGTARYTDDIRLRCNVVRSLGTDGMLHGVYLYAAAANSGIYMAFEHNRFDVPATAFSVEGPLTDPNITVIDTPDSGLGGTSLHRAAGSRSRPSPPCQVRRGSSRGRNY